MYIFVIIDIYYSRNILNGVIFNADINDILLEPIYNIDKRFAEFNRHTSDAFPDIIVISGGGEAECFSNIYI